MSEETISDYYEHCKPYVTDKEHLRLLLAISDERESYDIIRMYCAFSPTDIRTAIYELDTKCGISESPSPEQDMEEQVRILDLLDTDLIKYKEIFTKWVTTLSGDDRDLFITFAKLIFLFNGYQAPSRLDPEQAARDSMGLTDLFTELITPLIPQ